MDLDEMKSQLKKVKAPGIDQGAFRNRPVDDLIALLKVQDARDNKTLRRAMVFFSIAGAFYVGIFLLTWIAPPDDSPNLHRVLLGVFALVFLSIGIFNRKKSRELSGIDYAQPVHSFLADAGERYRFLSVKDLIFTVPYIIILTITCAVALMTGFERYLPSLDPAVGLLLCCVFFPVTWTAGFALAWRGWKRTKKPLMDEIREIQANLKEEGAI